MARITVEDCLKQTGHENRFALIHLAIERVKQYREGHPCLVEGKNKEVVMALREIAANLITADNIRDFTAKSLERKPSREAIEKEKDVDSLN